ncbi:MAG: hypothetical protein ACQGVC_01745 [Myxococcota bacterium]
MHQMHYKPDSWFWAVVLQADWRLALVFLRRDPRGWTIPPGFLARAVILIVCAWAVRLDRASLKALLDPGAAAGSGASLVEHAAWGVYLIATAAVVSPIVCANQRRGWQGRETENGRSWYFAGWPRVMNLRAFDAAGYVERQNMWWRSTVLLEPLVGIAASGALALASPSLGLYVLLNVLWLWKESVQMTRAAALERRKFQEAVLERAHMQRLVEAVDTRHRGRAGRDGSARLG